MTDELLLKTDTKLLNNEQIIRKNFLMNEQGIYISKEDLEIFNKTLHKGLSNNNDIVNFSNSNSEIHLEDKNKERKKRILKLIAKNTGYDLEILEKTTESISAFINEKTLVKSVYQLMSMRSISNSISITSELDCTEIEKKDFSDILELIEEERRKAYIKSIIKEFIEETRLSAFIVEEGIKIQNVKLDYKKNRKDLIEDLKQIFFR